MFRVLSTTPSASNRPSDGANIRPGSIPSTEASSNAPYISFQPISSLYLYKFSVPPVTPLGNPSSSTTTYISNRPTDGANTRPVGIPLIESSRNTPYTSFQPSSSETPYKFSLPRLRPSGN